MGRWEGGKVQIWVCGSGVWLGTGVVGWGGRWGGRWVVRVVRLVV